MSKAQKQKSASSKALLYLLAGPVSEFLLGILLHYVSVNTEWMVGQIPILFIAQLFIWASFANLLPIYPLDGGQLINRICFEEEEPLSNLYFIFSILIITGIAIAFQYYFLLPIPH